MSPTTVGLLIVAILAVITILSSLRICNEWERKVVLRLGRFGGVRGPGVFFLLPYVEQTPFTIDTRVTTTAFMAEQTLTKDGASVTVDAIMYWRIVDAGRAAIQVVNFTQAVMGAAQGGLRDIIGRSGLSTVIVVPSSALESMNLGAIGGISALGSMPDARAPDVKTEPTELPR